MIPTKEQWFRELMKDYYPPVRKVAAWSNPRRADQLIPCDVCRKIVTKRVIRQCDMCGMLYNLKTYYCSVGCLSKHFKEHHMVGGQLRPSERAIVNIPKVRSRDFYQNYKKRMKDQYGDRSGIP